MNKIKVLLVEDETSLAMILSDTLEAQGFEDVYKRQTMGIDDKRTYPVYRTFSLGLSVQF